MGATVKQLAALLLASMLAMAQPAQADTPLPRIEAGALRPMLVVDGQPFTALAVQANNSSNYPAILGRVWPVVDRVSANTLMMPVAWEQIEPVEGRFDFSFVDTLLGEAQEQDKRLILLWYGTWKNTSPAYVPAWVKRDPQRFPRMRHADGGVHEVLSPHGEATMQADARAFAQLMRHLAAHDTTRRVIMVQVQNEAGSWGLARDHSPQAEALFAAPIPDDLARAMDMPAVSWADAFGTRAEQFFMSWHIARYIDHVARAGQAELALPMIANAALGNAFTDEHGEVGPSGGPNWNALPIWRVAAPSLAGIGPDIYTRDAAAVHRFLDRYSEHGPLMVTEIGNAAEYARFVWPAMGRGAVLFSPFGMDHTGYSNYPLGAKLLDEATLEAFAAPFRLFASAGPEWARIAADRPIWGVARGNSRANESTVMGRWRLTAQFGSWAFGEDGWTWIATDPHPLADQPEGGLVAAQLAEDVFLVSGRHVRLRLSLADPQGGERHELIEAQEGTFVNGEWVMTRRWNGDQIDYGFNFGAEPVWLRIEMHALR
ncbi:DUF5597 domain-containing protein [Altererythrobacter lauratis]|uniref:DUF5597 domain-containing protein n=1 Tax=Alteraurantiacibacter lauratis TaxID=2054627 RepID=A0ABV7EDI4_9SPHN